MHIYTPIYLDLYILIYMICLLSCLKTSQSHFTHNNMRPSRHSTRFLSLPLSLSHTFSLALPSSCACSRSLPLLFSRLLGHNTRCLALSLAVAVALFFSCSFSVLLSLSLSVCAMIDARKSTRLMRRSTNTHTPSFYKHTHTLFLR